ncbi:hypothetical protein [Paenibacillus sp. NEAU-GSW1]|uniref:hypothetical protein n=1 Tax=Paenibacillus sp. NEAU-GSW1 TaxID=2682486 RepID=UPI0012E1A519|nr:hypothetical protein [Paenibacillus sp. NEAU-GSW1]MUT66019.1 hypothetical protein [Paenibacillus sp. NEAU-GSW1]
MRLYRYTIGHTELYSAADNDEEAYERRTEVDPTFGWTPVVIEEVKLEGYEITVTPLNGEPSRNRGGRPRREV